MATASYGSQGSSGGGGGGGSGTVASVASADGSVAVTNPTTTPDLSVRTVANWAMANYRWYALDGIDGNDANVGYSDASSAAAGLIAKATVAGLAAILPRVGANRKVAIIIRSGSYAGQGNIGQILMSSMTGFQAIKIWATDTVASANSTAFLGDAADRQCAGFTTATGMNAGGYAATGALSASLIQCTLFGGGAPAFAAEPALPLWVRVRFDSGAACTVAANRNVSRWIRIVTGTDTLTPGSAFPAAPAAGDKFYVEMPNIVIDSFTSTAPAQGLFNGSITIVGLRSTGAFLYNGQGRVDVAGCMFGSFTAQAGSIAPTFVPADESGATRTVGMALRSEGGLTTNTGGQWNANLSATGCGSVGLCSFTTSPVFCWSFGSSAFGGATIQLQGGGAVIPSLQPLAFLGGRSHTAEPACRIRGFTSGLGLAGAVKILWCALAIDAVDISNPASAVAGIVPHGSCKFSVTSTLTGTSLDVGLDLTQSYGSQIFIYSAPTLTGSLGDVRLADGTIVTWVQAMAGIVDTNGNILQGAAGSTPLKPTAVANGAVVVALGAFGPAGSSATPTRWVRQPDGLGGFFTWPSYT